MKLDINDLTTYSDENNVSNHHSKKEKKQLRLAKMKRKFNKNNILQYGKEKEYNTERI